VVASKSSKDKVDQLEIEKRIKFLIDQKVDAQLNDTFPASDSPNFEAIAAEARAEAEAEHVQRSNALTVQRD
jgi:hypothetical protein